MPLEISDSEWGEHIAEAQSILTYALAGQIYQRVPYGSEAMDRGAAKGLTCHDCLVEPGQYHVPGCDAERCPRCGGQAIGCDCSRITVGNGRDGWVYDDPLPTTIVGGSSFVEIAYGFGVVMDSSGAPYEYTCRARHTDGRGIYGLGHTAKEARSDAEKKTAEWDKR